MQYYFLLGKNPEFSKLELVSVLKKLNCDYSVVFHLNDELVLDFKEEIDLDRITERLAGILKIGKIFRSTEGLDENVLDQIDFYFPKNFNLYLSSKSINFNTLEDFQVKVKKYTKKAKLRGSIKIISDDTLQASAGFKHDHEGICELGVIKTSEKHLYAQIVHYSGSEEFKYKDEKRPAQRFTHGSSFRLAKMMVNILDLEQGKTVVDPFSGIGTFLTEAMSAGYNAVGVDNDPSVHQDARKNMDWAVKEFNLKTEYELIFGDSTIAEFKADACVFEPYMGPFLKELPKAKQAKKTMQELHGLYIKVFKNLHNNLSKNAPVVCILPSFQTVENQEIKIPNDLFSQSGFKLEDISERHPDLNLQNPIDYAAADGSKILRRLYVLRRV